VGTQVILNKPITRNYYSTKYFFVKGFGGVFDKMPEHKVKPHPIECYRREFDKRGKSMKKAKASE
jgi:hypothetical protein